ncbi:MULTISPECIES: FixH family protein [Pontibacillus]|uniref:FixH family protein n=1 Tax=Pontibacillus chungwhensis TaxID=265426 RepID=A0ABY8V165_9BACI|nr:MULTISPECIES: FixH family protein [Pontibacillus]WIF98364.1 FixH family protein [Pontibacillus chungwhensis]
MNILFILGFCLMALAACGSEGEASGSESDKPITAKILTVPEELTTEQISTLQVKVSQGDQKVDEAKKVTIKWAREGEEPSDEKPSQKQGNGLYSIQHTFDEAGTYRVVAVVEVNGQHKEVEKEIEVEEPND